MLYREKEITSLKQAYQGMQQTGNMQLRFICGEAGSGKTVLANMFMDEMSENAEQALFVSSYCGIRSEYNIPYQPFKELLKQLLQDVNNNTEEKTRKEKVKDSLAFCGKMLLEHAPDLVGNFIPGVSILSAIGQNIFKDKEEPKPLGFVEESKILEQYVDAIRAIAAKYKLVLFIDDLQWIDNASVNLFYQLVVGLQNSPVLIIGCYRSTDIDITLNGEKHPMTKLITEVKILRGNVFINLDAQSEEERKTLMNRMLDTEPNIYDTQFRERLFKHTNGNPLFVNELVNLLKEEGMIIRNNDGIWMNNASLQWKSYPVRIEGIIQERIGRLEDSLVETLSHASVQGYNFIAQVLSKTMGESERDVLMTLSKTLQKQHHLVNEDNCIRSNHGMVSHFNFSNYIFQQYLYQELSMTQRMMLHSDIAGIMEDFFKENIEEVSADIARHYEMSGEYGKAIRYIRITIENMMRISAYQDATNLIKKGLSLLDGASEIQDREKEKLYFLVKLCICIRSTKGWGNAEVEEVHNQAAALSEKLEDYSYTGTIRFGIWAIQLAKLELDKCLELAGSYLEGSRKTGDIKTEKSALITYINTLFWMGRLQEMPDMLNAYAELEQAGNSPKENTLNLTFYEMFSILLAVEQNNSEQIELFKNRLVEKTKQPNSCFIQTVAYQALTWQAYLQGNNGDMEKYANALIEISQKYNFVFYTAIAMLFQGVCMAKQDVQSGFDSVEKGYRMLREQSASEATSMHSIYRMAGAQCLLEGNRADLFEHFIDAGIQCSKKKNERVYLADLYMLKGIYFQRNNQPEKASDCFRQALEAARNSGSVRAGHLINQLTN